MSSPGVSREPAAAETAAETAAAAPREPRWEQVLVVVGIVLLAVNLRPAATSLGALLGQTQQALSISAPLAGLLTTLPVLCFACFGPVATALGRHWGLHRTTLLTLVLVVAGLLTRAVTDSALVFAIASGCALAGMASGNVLLPPLVKRHFPHRVGLLTAVYSTALMTGAALPAWTAVPVGEATGSWRYGLGMWGLVAAVAVLPWIGLLRHDVREDDRPRARYAMRDVVRSRLAWQMALFFGIQSSFAYTQFGWLPKIYADAGLDPLQAGMMLGLLTSVGIPLAVLLPAYAARQADQRPLVTLLGAGALAGWVGLLASPTTLPWLWALLLGVGGSAFPWCLTMIGLRAHSQDGTAVLSGFAQSIGYVVAALGPLGTGLLYDLSGGWTVPLAALAVLTVPLVGFGLTFARPRYIEDELPRRDATGPVGEPPRST
ncbi:MAG TPA: MFS transporter [Nocardioidaceae bacterium]|nr:MFS transporter [Nocardioidaceae bacterium]